VPPTKVEVLQELAVGARIAEEEFEQLVNYFIETDQWRSIVAGEKDIVFGPKGSGKSAIYATLLDRANDMFDSGVLLVSAENPRGALAFEDVASEPPTSEVEFIGIWKLYILTLAGRILREYEVKGEAAGRVQAALAREGLAPPPREPLRGVVRRVRDYVTRLINPKSVGTEASFDPISGAVAVKATITLAEPSAGDREKGFVSVDELLADADSPFDEAGWTLWLLFDRLDVAFADSRDLEANALRALFKVYLDLTTNSHLKVKIFLRSDIWTAITEGGFREASHITRHTSIRWNPGSLLHLTVRRLLQNERLCGYYGVTAAQVPASDAEQRTFVDGLVPDQIDSGRNPKTFEWLLGRAQDGTRGVAPRELIHLLTEAKNAQLALLERGSEEPEGNKIFARQAFRDALPEVSRVRLDQTLYAEYPEMKQWVGKLEREKTNQTPSTLAAIWGVSEDEATRLADSLVDIGFFERRGTKEDPNYWVPFLYRPALNMIQGTAESEAEEPDLS